jgi:predicted RNase H-like nuclease
MSEVRGGETVFVGIDLAWGPTNRTGVVAAAGGSVVDSRTVLSDDQICDWLEPYMGGPVLVAVDAPLIVRNPAGTSRPCDRKISKVFGASHAGAHSANLGLAAFSAGVRAERLARRLGLSTDPYIQPGQPVRRMIEVYPHPAMVSLFGLSFTLKYKAKRGRSVDDRRQAFSALTAHLERLTISDPPLSVGTAARWDELRDSLVVDTSNGQLDIIEDELDAYMCAYIGFYYWTHGASRCRVVGDIDTGYIVTPVTPATGAALDANLYEIPVRPVRKTAGVPRRSTKAGRLAPARAPQIVPTPTGQCGCGCGGPVRNRYLPGHDARHKEGLIRAALVGHLDAETRLAELGWSKFLESRRAAGRWR